MPALPQPTNANAPAHPCSSAEPRKRRVAFAEHVTASSAWNALNGTQPASQALLDGLFSMAAAMPAPGWGAALALLCTRRCAGAVCGMRLSPLSTVHPLTPGRQSCWASPASFRLLRHPPVITTRLQRCCFVHMLPVCRGKQWDQAALRRHLQPLLDAAAEELQVASPPTSGADAAGSGPAVCLVLTLTQFAATPWELGCHVPPPLAQLLWAGYCSHLADSCLGDYLKLLTADGGDERLAAAASEALTAAPSATHVMQLATKLVEQFPSWLDAELKVPVAAAALAAARSLAEVAQGGVGAGDGQAERGLLVAALAAGAWRVAGEAEVASAARSEALALVRRCLRSPGSLVPLLLDLSYCQELRSEALGIQETELEMMAYFGGCGRRSAAGPRRGRRGARLAVDPSFLRS